MDDGLEMGFCGGGGVASPQEQQMPALRHGAAIAGGSSSREGLVPSGCGCWVSFL